jgi:hypothetical protein
LGALLAQLVNGGINMLWLFITASGAGMLLGLGQLRVATLIAASVALAVTALVLLRLGQWPLLEAILYTFMLLITLQCSYLAGFFLKPLEKYRHRM